jgi:DNA-binding MarR family transcriptional regulator
VSLEHPGADAHALERKRRGGSRDAGTDDQSLHGAILSTILISLVFGDFLIPKDTRTDRDRQALVGAVGRATQAYQRATDGFDDAVGRVLGLNPTDLRCLDWLTERPMSAGELSAATGLSSAATTTLLDRLEVKGFVRRVRDPADRRRVMAELTPDGLGRIGALYGPLVTEGGALLGPFSADELAAMLQFLTDATRMVDQHRDRVQALAPRRGPRPG